MLKLHTQSGLSLIETLGVVSIVAVLSAITVPRVYDLIADSKAESLASAVKIYEQAISKYYSDMGSLLPLNSQGVPTHEPSGDSRTPYSLPARLTLATSDPEAGTKNYWTKFHGPYLEKFDTDHPPELGQKMYMPTGRAIPIGTRVSASSMGWDLKGDDGKSDLPTNTTVVSLRLSGLTPEYFLRFDRVLEPDIGDTVSERKQRGRAKYDHGTSTLYLYLAHQ